MATRSLLDRFMSSYGIGMTFGVFGAMSWHHLNRYQFHHINKKMEEEYRENGYPKYLKKELRAKWAEIRRKEILQQLKMCGYVLGVAGMMAIIIRISRRTFRQIPSPTKENRLPISDTTAAFVFGALLINGPYFLFDFWEGERIAKWKAGNEEKGKIKNN
ncbi:unnamed protein product [Meloidogyne enterolobii]|uniref:Uncharacterized protein n=1 Tax=Meloidogyne enterolobii TaxID=390850 RepID=A0ACB0YYQ5_MELEN